MPVAVKPQILTPEVLTVLDPTSPAIPVTGHGDILMVVQAIRTTPLTLSPSSSPPT
ncbi:hypothetical protein SS05631_a45760 (plasmid) [Sinorhizobium sp. CCBAU 05631]|nr:hypothetical protein SS05631_a45760 [Sinorhizobium sp. CCBAU 05631]